MSRPPSGVTMLDAEPRRHGNTAGPPPAYHRPESETGSDYSSVSHMAKRRQSTSFPVEADENLTAVPSNQYPRVSKTPSLTGSLNTSTAAASQVQPFNPNHRPPSHLAHFGSQLFVVPKGTLVDAAPGQVDRPVRRANSSAAPSVANSDAILADGTRQKRNRLQELRNWCANPKRGLCCLCVSLLVIVGIVAAIVIPIAVRPPKRVSLSFQAPEQLRGSATASTSVQMVADGDQVRFNIRGSAPLKGNFISVYDFKTNNIGVVDESLKYNGRQLFCFILPLDRSNIPDEYDLRKAARDTKMKTSQTQGWQEAWRYQPQPVTIQNQTTYFSKPISECNGARWVKLDLSSASQKNQQCTDCHQFCLPGIGIEKDTVRDEAYLNVLELECFQLFVPEWRQYAQANTVEQNQRDFETYYRMKNQNGGAETKWINVQGQPNSGGYAGQTNGMNNGVNSMSNGANGMVNGAASANGNNLQNLQNTVFNGGLHQQQTLQQQQQQQQLQQQQYMQERHPGLVNGQFGPIGPTGLGGVANTATLPPGAPPTDSRGHLAWHHHTQQTWINDQSASNPAMPPIGWTGPNSQNGNSNNNNMGQYGTDSSGITGTLNRALNTAQTGVKSVGNTIQQGASNFGSAVQSGIHNIQSNVDSAGKSAQDLLQEARQRLYNQNTNNVNPPSGYFQQANPRQGGYPNYEYQQQNQAPTDYNNGNLQTYNVQPF